MARLRLLLCTLAAVLASVPFNPHARGAEPLPEVAVFTSGTEGYHTFRIPALVSLRGGALLAICEGRKTGRGDHGDLDLVQKRSADGGQTWSPLELIYEEGGEKKVTIGNPCPVVDSATGTIWLPFTRDNDHVLITFSKDDGKTWAAPRDITADVKPADWNWYATGPGNGIELARGAHQGRLIIPCDHRVTGSKEWNHAGRSHVIYSDDHGQTWKLGGSTDFAMNECAVVELADGTLMLNSRSYRGKACRGISLSKDGGLTWQPTVDDPALVEPVCQASLIAHDPPGAPAAGKRPLIFCNPAVPKDRHHLTVRVSDDEGQSWPRQRLICEASSAYSSLAAIPGGQIGLLYEKDGYKRLVFTKFSLSDIPEKRDGGK